MKEYLRILTLYAGLLSCTSKPITSGTVAQKWHEPERAYAITEEDLWTGKEITRKFLDDEDYVIVLRQWGGTKFRSTRERRLYVNKARYDSLQIGDSVDLQKSGILYEDSDKDVEKK